MSSSRIPSFLLNTTRHLRRAIPTSRLVQATSVIRNSNHSSNHSLLTITTGASSSLSRPFHSTAVKMVVYEIRSMKEYNKEIADNKAVILDCYADWCGPCRVIAPQMEAWSNEFPKIKFLKLNVDNVVEVAEELGIRAMPTFIFYKNNEKSDEVVGANPIAIKTGIDNLIL